MRRRPTIGPELPDPPRGVVANPREIPTQEADCIVPYLVCGGQTFYTLGDGFDPREGAVQLLASVYVPRGQVGFVKEIRVAPFMPPALADPWTTTGANPLTIPNDANWRYFEGPVQGLGALAAAAAGTNGVWTTPFGWESYFNDGGTPPRWRWNLRFLQGSIAEVKGGRKIPEFDSANPASWFLAQDVPVPAAAYAGGLPGTAPGPQWNPQRMQVIQGDKLSTHVPVPPNTTVLLFASWTQAEFTPQAQTGLSGATTEADYALSVYPLLPSFGQLHGYTQGIGSNDATKENALHGWGG